MRTPLQFFKGIFHPEAFHGHGRSKRYFEGWYVKVVSADQKTRWAVIPGVFLGLDGGVNEAFIQLLDGSTGRSWYHKFETSEFSASADEFDVTLGKNHFSSKGVTLDLPELRGSIRFESALDPWPVKPLSPGIMGWFGAVPFMECFHGIVSFGHGLSGTLQVEGVEQSFDAGRGYIEKDWGKAFPDGYIWLASNHIDGAPDAALIGSVAIIPWLGGAFRGFIVGLKHGGTLHRWTTYNRATQRQLEVDDSHVRWALEGPDGVIELEAERVRGGLLKAPQRKAMLERVEETLDARVHIRHTDPHGKVLLEGTAHATGLEIVGDIDRLIALR